MTYSPVIPASYQSNRQDLNDALMAILNAFIVSESYQIGRLAQSELPDNLAGEGPLICLGDIVETIEHDSGTRTTTFTGSVWYIDWLTARAEYNARVNRFADHMRDLFTANARILTDGVLQQTGFADGEIRQGSMAFGAPQLAYTYVIQEGRDQTP